MFAIRTHVGARFGRYLLGSKRYPTRDAAQSAILTLEYCELKAGCDPKAKLVRAVIEV